MFHCKTLSSVQFRINIEYFMDNDFFNLSCAIQRGHNQKCVYNRRISWKMVVMQTEIINGCMVDGKIPEQYCCCTLEVKGKYTFISQHEETICRHIKAKERRKKL